MKIPDSFYKFHLKIVAGSRIWDGLTWEDCGICLKVILCLWGIPQDLFHPKMHLSTFVGMAVEEQMSFHQQGLVFAHSLKRSPLKKCSYVLYRLCLFSVNTCI